MANLERMTGCLPGMFYMVSILHILHVIVFSCNVKMNRSFYHIWDALMGHEWFQAINHYFMKFLKFSQSALANLQSGSKHTTIATTKILTNHITTSPFAKRMKVPWDQIHATLFW